MAKNLIIFGPPGAGKGTQSDAIKNKLDVFHLSTGDMLREAIKNETETGKQAKQYTDAGKLVPDEVVIKIVEEKVASLSDKGVLFDGFPRTLAQAKALDEMLEKLGRSIDAVISIKVPDEDIVKRLTGRRMCPKCNTIYHIAAKPPKQEGICDNDGEKLIIRDDDREEVIRNRLNTYHEQTSPVLDYYREKGVLKEVDGTGKPDEVTAEISALFK